jgi:hypothetical protein
MIAMQSTGNDSRTIRRATFRTVVHPLITEIVARTIAAMPMTTVNGSNPTTYDAMSKQGNVTTSPIAVIKGAPTESRSQPLLNEVIDR